MGRSVHVLFVHGVGHHSPLSSLLRAYQALRSNLKSDEPPAVMEDPIPGWRLAEFNDTGAPQFLRLVSSFRGVQPVPDNVYLYEVNYSTLAGLIRANQPIDLTRLFLGLDLAVNVARHRLENDLKSPAATDALKRDKRVAEQVQKLAGVLVAATMPILGIPAILLRQFTQTFVTAFTRFFEDIVTFALDKNGEQLISRHVDSTLQKIVGSSQFRGPSHIDPEGDTLVIAAHSLGTVVTHNFLLRHWSSDGPQVPRRLITYGSPIGLVCWIWLFLDFPRLQFTTDPAHFTGDEFFCWKPELPPTQPLRPIKWLNVLNYLDPIATAFPLAHVNLAMNEATIRTALAGHSVTHHYIRCGSVFSAHTDYMDDREGFMELLCRVADLTPDDPPSPQSLDSADQWRRTRGFLLIARCVLWSVGMLFVAVYVTWLARLFHLPLARALGSLWLYVWPPATIAYFAGFQRFLFGSPTKRLRADAVGSLRWKRAFPYRLRLKLRLPEIRGRRILMPLISFLPAILSMGFPVLWCRFWAPLLTDLIATLWNNLFQSVALLALFMLYALAFALTEFTGQWRSILGILGQPAALPPAPPVPAVTPAGPAP